MKEETKKSFGTAFTVMGILFIFAGIWGFFQNRSDFVSLIVGLCIAFIFILIGTKLEPDVSKVFE